MGGRCRGLAGSAKMSGRKLRKTNHDKMRTICFPFSYQCYWPNSAAETGRINCPWTLSEIYTVSQAFSVWSFDDEIQTHFDDTSLLHHFA